MKKGEYVRDVDVAITTVVLVVGIRWLSQDFGSMLRMVVCMYVCEVIQRLLCIVAIEEFGPFNWGRKRFELEKRSARNTGSLWWNVLM